MLATAPPTGDPSFGRRRVEILGLPRQAVNDYRHCSGFGGRLISSVIAVSGGLPSNKTS